MNLKKIQDGTIGNIRYEVRTDFLSALAVVIDLPQLHRAAIAHG